MTQEEILGIIRHLLTALGGVLVTKGVVDSGTVEAVVGGLLAIGGAVWSVYHKKQTAKAIAEASK